MIGDAAEKGWELGGFESGFGEVAVWWGWAWLRKEPRVRWLDGEVIWGVGTWN